MMPRRPTALLFWLAALIVTGLGMVVPVTAMAHPGHGHGPSGVREAAAPATVDLEWLDLLAIAGEHQAASVETMSGAPEVPACGGAACCNTGHGCCAAILGICAWPLVATPAAPPGALKAGQPPGLGPATLPEPPRPFR